MAIEKNIKINVDTDQAVTDLNKLEKGFKEVDQEAEKAGSSIKDVGDNGGAIAVLDSVTGGLATRVRDAAEASKLLNFNLKGMRTALIATGVGAFLISLALVIEYWDEINDLMTGATKKLERQHELYQQIISDIDHQLELNKLDQEINEKKGESVENLKQLEKDLLLQKQETIKTDLESLRIQLATEESKKREFTLLEKGLVALKAYVFGYDKVGQAIVGALGFDVISELEGKINELETLAKQTELALLGEGDGDIEAELEQQANILSLKNEVILGKQTELNDALNEQAKKQLESETLRDQLRQQSLDATAAQEIFQAEPVKNAKIAIGLQTLNILGSLAKEGSALAKGIAASQATINTFQGVTAALSATSVIPDPFGTILKFVNAAAIGVAGFINVKKILSTKPVTTSSSGGRGDGAPPAPSFNLVQGTGSNQIAQSINNQNLNPQKAFVVSKDVSSGQELDRQIEGSNTL